MYARARSSLLYYLIIKAHDDNTKTKCKEQKPTLRLQKSNKMTGPTAQLAPKL
jgi:hypothetical protein